MRYLKGEEKEKAEYFLKKAEEAANKAKCLKSSRGVVIVKEGRVIGEGWNGPLEEICNKCLREDIKDDSRTELCRGMHAEQRAIINALKESHSLEGSTIYLIRLKNGIQKPEKGPSCSHCSKMMLETGVKEFVEVEKEGIALYTAEEFYKLSMEYFTKKKGQ
ncbi:MAG: deaminase [Candidatus Woesearchaeota archaeon]